MCGMCSFASQRTIPARWQPDLLRRLGCARGPMEANGAWISRTTYSMMFAAIGVIYNVGDGSTTFWLARPARRVHSGGWDNGRGLDAGRLVGSWQGDAIRNIAGTFGGYTAKNSGSSGAFTSDLGTVHGSHKPITLTKGKTRQLSFPQKQLLQQTKTAPENAAALICIKY